MTEGPELFGYINGFLSAGFVVSAAFFIKFWRRTGERLFFAFACAFLLLGIAQPLPMLLGELGEQRPEIYLIRLAAFILIILAVLAKNVGRR